LALYRDWGSHFDQEVPKIVLGKRTKRENGECDRVFNIQEYQFMKDYAFSEFKGQINDLFVSFSTQTGQAFWSNHGGKKVLSKRVLKESEQEQTAPTTFFTMPRGQLKSELEAKNEALREQGFVTSADMSKALSCDPRDLKEQEKKTLKKKYLEPLL